MLELHGGNLLGLHDGSADVDFRWVGGSECVYGINALASHLGQVIPFRPQYKRFSTNYFLDSLASPRPKTLACDVMRGCLLCPNCYLSEKPGNVNILGKRAYISRAALPIRELRQVARYLGSMDIALFY